MLLSRISYLIGLNQKHSTVVISYLVLANNPSGTSLRIPLVRGVASLRQTQALTSAICLFMFFLS